MTNKVASPSEIIVTCGTLDDAAVYCGSLTDLRNITDELEWKHEKDGCDEIKWLSLEEVSSQLQNKYKTLTVITTSLFQGEIYQYEDRAREWWVIGKHCGYA